MVVKNQDLGISLIGLLTYSYCYVSTRPLERLYTVKDLFNNISYYSCNTPEDQGVTLKRFFCKKKKCI